MSTRRRRTRGGAVKARLPLPGRGPQAHRDRRHDARKYASRRRQSGAWREWEDVLEQLESEE